MATTTKAKAEAETKIEANTIPAEEELVEIKLPIDPTGKKGDQFVSVNERTWLVKRGVTVRLPRCAVEQLQWQEDAEMEAYLRQQQLIKG